MNEVGTIGNAIPRAISHIGEEQAGTGKQPVVNKTATLPKEAKTLFSVAQDASKKMLETLGKQADMTVFSEPANLSMPVLTEPKPSVREEIQFDSKSKFTLLLGQAMTLLGESSVKDLSNRLQVALAKSASVIQSNEARSSEFQQALAVSQTALDIAQADVTALELATAYADEMQAAFNQADEALSLLTPEDEGFEQAKTQLAKAERELTGAKTQVAKAEVKANQSYEIAKDKVLAVDRLLDSIKADANQLTPQNNLQSEQTLGAMSRMMLLISMFIQLVDKNSQQSLESDSELFQKIQDTVQLDMKQQAEKATQEMRKAETLNKAMGCAGKILGGLITAISVVGAVFTGGASLAFAAVGVALMVGDQIGKAITGTSFMEKMLNPMMEKVIQPLISVLGKAITQMLEKMGVDSSVANMIGNVVGAVIAVALIIAVVLVGKAAAGKVAASALGKMVAEAVKKLVPDVLKNITTKSGAMVSNSLKRLMDKMSVKSDAAALQKIGNTVNQANNYAVGVNVGTQGGLGIAKGIAENNVHKSLSRMAIADSVLEQIKKLLSDLVEMFTASQTTVTQLWSNLYNQQQKNAATTNFLASNLTA